MHLKELQVFFQKYEAKTYLVAVSGGIDSIVLLHAMNTLGLSIKALHVNYQLRGEESNADEDFVRNLSEHLDIPLKVKVVNLQKRLSKGGNLQDTARKVRYDFFKKELQKEKNAYCVTAHTKSDQIENFWMHLIRNSGRSGISGMKEINGQIARPLLNVSRSEIRTYAHNNKLNWREDSSNQKNDYLRNVLRNLILPEIRSRFPGIEDNITLIQDLLKKQETKDLQEIRTFLQASKNAFDKASIKDWNSDKTILFLKQFGLDGHQFNEFQKFLNSSSGSSLRTKTGYFSNDRDTIYYFANEVISNNSGSIHIQHNATLPSQFNKTRIYLDKDKIEGEIKLRFWKKGDRVYPIGLKGSKLVSDVFTDSKIPVFEKKQIHLVCDDKSILFIPNLMVDRRKLASKNTKHIVAITYKND